MSNGIDYKHLIARVSKEFHSKVKIRLAQKDMTMGEAIVKGVARELDIDLSEFDDEIGDEIVATVAIK